MKDSEPAFSAGSDRPPAPTFRNSLRLWQARWQAQRAAGQAATDDPKENQDEEGKDARVE